MAASSNCFTGIHQSQKVKVWKRVTLTGMVELQICIPNKDVYEIGERQNDGGNKIRT